MNSTEEILQSVRGSKFSRGQCIILLCYNIHFNVLVTWKTCSRPIGLFALFIFHSTDLVVYIFHPIMLRVHFLLHPHYLYLLVFIPVPFPSISVMNICCMFCLNTAFIHSLHKFVNSLHYLKWTNNQVRFSASTQSHKKLMRQKCLNNKSRCSLPIDFFKCECTFVFSLVAQWSVRRDPPKADPFKFP